MGSGGHSLRHAPQSQLRGDLLPIKARLQTRSFLRPFQKVGPHEYTSWATYCTLLAVPPNQIGQRPQLGRLSVLLSFRVGPSGSWGVPNSRISQP